MNKRNEIINGKSFQEECTLSKDSVERYGIAIKKHAQEWVAEIEQMLMGSLFLW